MFFLFRYSVFECDVFATKYKNPPPKPQSLRLKMKKMDYCCIYTEEDGDMSTFIVFFPQKNTEKSNFIKNKKTSGFYDVTAAFSDAGVNAESV